VSGTRVKVTFVGAVRNDVVGHVALGEALCLDHQRHFLRLGPQLDHVAHVDPREAMLHFTPLTRMWPWLTSWRAAQIVGANLAR
jgi:hypothetical protein